MFAQVRVTMINKRSIAMVFMKYLSFCACLLLAVLLISMLMFSCKAARFDYFMYLWIASV